MEKLALHGGKPVFSELLNRYNSIGDEEVNAATKVLKTGALSPFLGDWKDIPNVGSFYGGTKVREFENVIKELYSVKYAITVNSWTSGLICAVGAIGIEPGDEIIVSPWTMCASATAILHWCAIPVFCDIEAETFNLDPESIKKNITEHTKAIMVPDIFGHPADMERIMKIAGENNLKVISDTAQAPLAKENGKFAGTISDIGGFSLNYHKHIQTGEGGILITNDDNYAEKMQLIRNHGEAVVEGKGVKDISNIIGYNFRLGEIEAAIGIEQFKKLDNLVSRRIEIANMLSNGLSELEGLKTPIIRDGFTHSFYVYGLTYDQAKTGVHRDKVYEALKMEGVPIVNCYANLHLLPMYQTRIAYGTKGFPWKSEFYRGNVSYKKGICPIAENLNDKTFLKIPICDYEFNDSEVQKVIQAFKKVWDQLEKLI
tara:strand:- start:1668 stop:2954 length:1287 start_codon:yes stop_codon:yes gene_type:complete